MEKDNYRSLGLTIFKLNQIFLLVFSFFLIGINYVLGSSLIFWFLLLIGVSLINLIWYAFADIKWNNEHFIVEKLFMTKVIPSDRFEQVTQMLFNIYIIKFTTNHFYYMGDLPSYLKNSSEITAEIKSHLNV